MSLFDSVEFGPGDVQAMQSSPASVPRCVRMAILTSTTCGEPCWHAREEVCRCSCGGRNHGCLLSDNGERPKRTAKIDGVRYNLVGVGTFADLSEQAKELNAVQFRMVDKPARLESGGWHQYYYTWSETDSGAPARLKTATPQQLDKWAELSGWRGQRGIYLLWQIETMPPAPSIPVVHRITGEPLEDQTPAGLAAHKAAISKASN